MAIQGSEIITEDEVGESLYFILSGKAVVLHKKTKTSLEVL
jgi:CRP-like cAMP-binding protein